VEHFGGRTSTHRVVVPRYPNESAVAVQRRAADNRLLPEELAEEHERTLKRFFQVTGIDITQFRGQGEEE
jgi:hypothetical protein